MLENPKGSPLSVFRHCETFFPKIFVSPKGPLFNFFDILQQIECLKPQSHPPFSFSALWDFFENLFFLRRVPPSTATKMLTISEVSPFLARQGLAQGAPARHSVHFFEYVIFSKNFRFSSTVKENTWHLEVFLLFLSLGYGADLGRSRLVNRYIRI